MAYIIVNGEVTRKFYEDKGLAIKEEFTKRDGSTGASYFTAFFDEPQDLAVGDKAVFKGNVSVNLRSYEKDGELRYSADATINNTKVEDVEYGSTPATQEPAAVGF